MLLPLLNNISLMSGLEYGLEGSFLTNVTSKFLFKNSTVPPTPICSIPLILYLGAPSSLLKDTFLSLNTLFGA